MWITHLLLGQIVGQVSDHDLGLGGDAIRGGATLTALALLVTLLCILVSVALGSIGDIGQRVNLLSGSSIGSRSLSICRGGLGSLALLSILALTTGTTGTSAVASTTATTATTRSAAASALGASTLGSLSLLTSRLGLAGKLNGNLALENLLAGELLDGTLGLGGSREVDEGVANRTVGTGVLGDGNGLAWGLSAKAR